MEAPRRPGFFYLCIPHPKERISKGHKNELVSKEFLREYMFASLLLALYITDI